MTGAPPERAGVSVFAAEGLRPALDAIAAAWAAQGNRPISASYGPSLALSKQITAGAPADVFISDQSGAMDDLVKAGLIVAPTRRNIIGNDLVLIGATETAGVLKIGSGFDLAGALDGGRLALCDPASCTAGARGKQALEALKVWPSLIGKVAQTGDMQAAILMVSRGEARFGIAVAVEVKAEPKVKVIGRFPASTYDALLYTIALLRTSKAPDAAFFEAYMRSGQATKILTSFGFTVLK